MFWEGKEKKKTTGLQRRDQESQGDKKGIWEFEAMVTY